MGRSSVALVMTAVVGGLIALQAPINSLLGRAVGTFQAALVSFWVGTIVLTGIVALSGGFGWVGSLKELPWYYLIGGLFGAAYVTTVLVLVRTLGAGGITAATVAGQLTLAVVIDRLGLLGVEARPITLTRVLGVGLLVAGTLLTVKGK